MAFTIRPVTAAETGAAVALIRDTLAEFGLQFGVGSETDDELPGLPASYSQRGGCFFVAVDDAGDVCGTAGVMPMAPGEYELRKMYLRPAARGHGLGGRLFDACVAFCRERGAHRIGLDTTEAMTAAIRFYEQRGFVRDDDYRRGSRCTRGYRLDLQTPPARGGNAE